MRFVYRYLLVLASALIVVTPFLVLLHLTYQYTEKYHYQIINLDPDKEPVNITSTQTQCRFYSCFDILRCEPGIGGRMKVYIHPDTRFLRSGADVFDEYSLEYEAILQAFRKNDYITSNISEACVIIPPLDLLSEKGVDFKMVDYAIASLKGWNHGTNHLIFNFFPTIPLLSTRQIHMSVGNAVIVGANFISSNYRIGFDVSVPLFNTDTALDPEKHHIAYSTRRKWHLIISQTFIDKSHRKTLRELEDDNPSVFMLRRCFGDSRNQIHYNELCKDGLHFKYPTLLKKGSFCLILRGPYFATTLLLDSMMMGCIPVIAMDEYIMPFEDIIDWTRASIRIREFQLPKLLDVLDQFDEDEIYLRRYQTFFLWKKYFSSIDNIVNTVLLLLNERIYINQKRSYEEWNGKLGELHGNVIKPGPSSLMYLPLRSSKDQGFTAVILTYNRVKMCMTLMKQLQKVPSLQKIIIVWNDPYSDPMKEKWPDIKKPWKLIRTKTNRLTNRFYPFKEIETEAVMSIDDDLLMLTIDEIEFAFQTWKEYPDRLVGFPARIHITHPKELINGKRLQYKYESEWSNSVSMVLTGAAFYHQIYNHWFTYKLPLKTINYIDEKMNCEDIGMNFLIANITGKSPIKVTPRKRFKCAQCRRNDSLWSESSHFIKRSECLSVFTEHFGKMPLEPVEFRADPVLFQEAVPRDMMAYPDVGIV